MIKRICALAIFVAGVGFSAYPAAAQTKVTLGLTQFNEIVPALIAKEEGFFAKRGLEVTVELIPLNSMMPAALQSDSIQIAGLTPPALLLATDGGLKLVAVAGGAVTSKSDTNFAIVAGASKGIKNATDMIGKKIGVPGLGATLHILTRKWLAVHGVDYNKVRFIEAPFAQIPGMIKGGSIDVAVSADPFKDRVLHGGGGILVANFLADLPNGLATFFYVSTADWATKHPAAATAFHQAIAEGVAFAIRNPNGARADFGKYIKLPPNVLASIAFTGMKADPNVMSLSLWIDIMNEQKMLKTKIDAGKLIFH